MNPNVAANKKHKTASRRGGDSVAADATMVERSSTIIVNSECFGEKRKKVKPNQPGGKER
jgi:hypothetical protein